RSRCPGNNERARRLRCADLDGCFRCSFGHFYFDCIVNNNECHNINDSCFRRCRRRRSRHTAACRLREGARNQQQEGSEIAGREGQERERKREEQMWRRHQMELQLKQRGIAPLRSVIKHNIKCGEGAYKRVYRGYDREQGRPIAWCELKFHVGKDKPAEREQVRKETKTAEKGEKVKATVIVTEFMSEGTLREKMKTFYMMEDSRG
uniref:Protein kinase domain-containing protein n=1 Tax=Macrostomum lignano TaxID=282301 RepID=A0A1I8FJU9_9PLAT